MKQTQINIEKELLRCSSLRDEGKLEKSLTSVIHLKNLAKHNSSALVKTLVLQGVIYRDLGKPDEALKTYEEALTIAVSNFLDRERADILRLQSYLFIQLGQPGRAESLAFESLRISREFDFKREEVDAVACIGHVLENNRDFQKALCWYQEGLEICKEHPYQERQSTLLGDIGKVYGIVGQLSESISFLKKALKLSSEIKYEKAIISSLYRLGDSYRSINDQEKAEDYYSQALNRSRMKSFKREQGDVLYRLGVLETANKHPDKALKFLLESVAVFEEVNYVEHRIHSLLAIGHALEQKADISGALNRYFSAFELIKDSINEHIDAFIQVVENITNRWQQLHYMQEATELTRLTGQLREYAGMSGVFEDFGKKEKLERVVISITAIIEKTRKMEGNIYTLRNLTIDFNTSLIIKDGQEIRLTEDQWKILRCLWKKKGEPCSRDELLATIGLKSDLDTRTIDVQVYKMRKKMGREYLPAAHGLGYSLSMKD